MSSASAAGGGHPATVLARSVLTALLEAGVTDVVVCPGSRNAPLSFAAYDAAAAGALRLHTRVDERSAGFLALGMARVTHRAVAVVCTSGTAVANLVPAALEAAHAGVRLLLVTADRPARLRGTGANQTTHQVGLMGPLVPVVDVASPADLPSLEGYVAVPSGPPRAPVLATPGVGPLHLNIQLDEPLLPDPEDRWVPPAGGRGGAEEVPFDVKRQVSDAEGRRLTSNGIIPRGPRTVVVAGDDAGPPARILAEQANWPLLAEPSSGSRTGTNAIRCYRLLLDTDLAARIERVVVFGHPTLSRPVTRLLARPDVEVLAAPAPGAWAERPFPVDGTVTASYHEPRPDTPDDTTWLDEWRAADLTTAHRLDQLLAREPALTAYHVAGAVGRALPGGGLLYVGASSPVRDLDLMVPRYDVGARRMVIANRGLAGIDGTVSSAIGAALGRPHSTRALALMGDVTFLHDSNGLLLGPDEPRPDLTIVVANDDGGSIFAMLEQGAPEYADRYEALFGTPHHVDLAALCAATRTPHWRVDTLAELEHALTSPNGGIEVIEAVVSRSDRRALDQRIRALAAPA